MMMMTIFFMQHHIYKFNCFKNFQCLELDVDCGIQFFFPIKNIESIKNIE